MKKLDHPNVIKLYETFEDSVINNTKKKKNMREDKIT